MIDVDKLHRWHHIYCNGIAGNAESLLICANQDFQNHPEIGTTTDTCNYQKYKNIIINHL